MHKQFAFNIGEADLGHTIVVGPTSAGMTFPQRFDSAPVTKVFPRVSHDAASYAFMHLTDAEFDKINVASGDTNTPA
ncbi:hypothetical protein D9M73_51880 [compost metagenome]